MAQIIEIEGSIVRLVERSVSHEVTLDKLEKYLTIKQPTVTPILPRGTVASFIDHDRNHARFLIERPPRVENITIKLLSKDRESIEQWLNILSVEEIPGKVAMPVPWEYYEFTGQIKPNLDSGESIYVIQTAFLYWSPTRVSQHGQTLYHAPLPNIDSNGLICWGYQNSNNQSLALKIDDMINNFYTYSFNEDYGHMTFPASLDSIESTPIDVLGVPVYEWENFRPHDFDWSRLTGQHVAAMLQTENETAKLIPGQWTGSETFMYWVRTLPIDRQQWLVARLNGEFGQK